MAYEDVERLLKIYSEDEVIDNLAYDEEKDIVIRFNNVNAIADIKYSGAYWGGDDVLVTYIGGGQSYERTIQCYGRPCMVMDWLGGYIEFDESSATDYLKNIQCNFRLMALDENHQLQTIENLYGFTFRFSEDNYIGSNEGLRNRINETKAQAFNLGFGNYTFSDNFWTGGRKLELSANIPIFKDTTDAITYQNTGDYTNAINPYIGEDLDKIWFYEYGEGDIIDSDKHINYTFETEKYFKLKKSTDKVRFVKNSTGEYAELRFNCPTVLLRTGRDVYTDTNINELIESVRLKTIGNKFGDLYTNIPIVNNFDDPIDSSDNYLSDANDNYTGIESEMDNTRLSGAHSPLGCYYISDNELNTIKNWLFHTDSNAWETLKNGLWQYGENPINCVVDLAYIPFNITNYVIMIAKDLQFGSLIFDGNTEGIPRINLANIIGCWGKVTHINQRIIPTYGDFRDYESVKYSLYLPYYGIIELDNSIVGNTLKVVSYFNAWTSSLKYYVYIGSSVVAMLNCEVGQHLALLGNDWINKSKQNVQSATNVIQGGGSLLASLLTLNPIGAMSASASIVSNTMNQLEKPQSMVSGATSNGINIYDDMNFYLIVEQYETIKPLNLYAEYGIPCYTIGLINTCKGFSIIEDVKLQSTATEEEQSEIIQLLKEGVII